MTGKTRKTALLGIFCTAALILSYIESLLPPIWVSVPGIKMGLANIAVIAVLYKFSFKEALAISFVRLLISFLLFGSVLTAAYSAVGAVLSLTLMYIFKKTNAFSVVGVSIIGGISHNIGQIAVAVFLFERVELWYYLAVLTITGTISGILIGIAGAVVYKNIKPIKI